MGDAVAQSVEDLLERAQRCAREGNLVEADLASAEALFLTRDDAAVASRQKVLESLSQIYLEEVPVRWSEAYTFPDPAVVRYRETCQGGQRIVNALAAAAKVHPGDASEAALRFLLAAANVEALFGATDSERRRVVDDLWTVAFDMKRIEEALAAATLLCALIPDFDEYELEMAAARHKLGRSLLALGRAAEALAAFERVLDTWRSLDRKRGREHGPTTIEAEVWVFKAKVDGGGASLDDVLGAWSSEADAHLASGDRAGAIAAFSKTALLGLESSRPADAARAASALRDMLSESDAPTLRLAADEWLGRALLDVGRPNDALEHFRSAVRLACDVYRGAAFSTPLEHYARLVEKAQSALGVEPTTSSADEPGKIDRP